MENMRFGVVIIVAVTAHVLLIIYGGVEVWIGVMLFDAAKRLAKKYGLWDDEYLEE